MAKPSYTRPAHHACGLVGRLFMRVAFAGERVLSVRLGRSPYKLGTWRGWRFTLACNWFDYWRGMVYFPTEECSHHTTNCPYC